MRCMPRARKHASPEYLRTWITVPTGCEVSMVQEARPLLLNSACAQRAGRCGWDQ